MASKGGYRKISGEEDKKVSFVSSLFYRWMNGVLKEGSQRPLDQNDFLPLSDENSGRSVTDKLKKMWESEKHRCKMNGKRPKLWKSVFDMLSAKDVIIILMGNILCTTSRLLFPLFLGYLVSKLMSTEAENTYRLYACTLAMCLNGLIGGLGMHQENYRCEILGIKIGSALRGLVYQKTLLLSKQTLLKFTAGRLLDLISNDVKRMEEETVKFFVSAVFAVLAYVGVIFLIYNLIGWQAVMGVFLLCVLMPYFAVLSYANAKLRLRTATASDQRISLMNQVVSGIRAVKTHAWEDEYGRKIRHVRRYEDVHNQAYIMVMASGRWLGARLDCLASLLVGAVALAAILVSQDAAYAGLALVYVIQTLSATQYAVRKTSEVENYMTSVERVMTYTRLDKEPGYEEERTPPKDWPQRGSIVLRDVSLTYYPGGPRVLKNINLSIKGGAKIGVAGRTGAGKSSFVAALMRMPNADGKIIIDDVPIKEIGLQQARRGISVLGQSPVLFSGSLRKNLDILDKFQDAELWQALEDVQLKDFVERLETKLDHELLEHGANVSVGERQLICLARVLLQRSKIVVLDEPTAHVDPDTEETIWNVVRDKLKESTVITIAHRLNTIKDCEKILVLKDGKVKGFDNFDSIMNIK